MKTKALLLIAAVTTAFVAGQISQAIRSTQVASNHDAIYRLKDPTPAPTPDGPNALHAHKRIFPLPPGQEEKAFALYQAYDNH